MKLWDVELHVKSQLGSNREKYFVPRNCWTDVQSRDYYYWLKALGLEWMAPNPEIEETLILISARL